MTTSHTTETIFHLDKHSVALKYQVCRFKLNAAGRVIIPASFKEDKEVIAVCDGIVNVRNSLGDRAENFINQEINIAITHYES